MITKPIESPMTVSTKKKTAQIGPKQASKLAQFVPETIQSCHVSGYQPAQYLGLLTMWAYFLYRQRAKKGRSRSNSVSERATAHRPLHCLIQPNTSADTYKNYQKLTNNRKWLPKLVPHLNIWIHGWWETIESSQFSSRDIDANAC